MAIRSAGLPVNSALSVRFAQAKRTDNWLNIRRQKLSKRRWPENANCSKRAKAYVF